MHLSGVQFDTTVKQVLGLLPTIATVLVLVFDSWAWRWPLVQKAFNRPRIDGTWLGHLVPTPKSHIPTGGNRGPITVAVIIDQTFWTASATLLSAEGRSFSSSAAIRPHGHSRSQHLFAYTYLNEPNQAQRPRSQPHAGAAELRLSGISPNEMSGTYWTARLTAGDMELHLFNRRTNYSSLTAVQQDIDAVSRATQDKAGTAVPDDEASP